MTTAAANSTTPGTLPADLLLRVLGNSIVTITRGGAVIATQSTGRDNFVGPFPTDTTYSVVAGGVAIDIDLVTGERALVADTRVPARMNAAGTALLGLEGVEAIKFAYPSASTIEILPTGDIAQWNTDKTAALTVAVDTSVLFDGRPTLKITIPAGTSGVCKVGTNIASALVPHGFDRSGLALAVMHSGFTGYDYSASFPPVPVPYLGDAAYTNFWLVGGASLGSYPETKPRAGEWFVYKPEASQVTVGTGAPVAAASMRSKVQWTQVSQVTDSFIWIGLFGLLPSRPKATLVWCLDDGYAEWDTFIKPLFKHYNMPVSMGFSKNLVGGAGYMNAAEITALHNDPSGLFDVVNHAVDNTAYNVLGVDAYYAQVVENLSYLRSIGINHDGPLHHPIVQSQWGNDLVDKLVAGGFLTARSSQMDANMHGKDQLIRSGQDKLRWILSADTFLGSGITLAGAKTLVDNAVTRKDFFMIGAHEFKDSGGVALYTWTRADMEQLVGYVHAQVAAGLLEVKTWSQWYADLTGRNSAHKSIGTQRRSVPTSIDVPYAATVTPNAGIAVINNIGTLTGAITIAAPTTPSAGQQLVFNYTQDAVGGRVVTYNAAFKSSAIAAAGVSTKGSHSFVYDGTNWVQTGGPLLWL